MRLKISSLQYFALKVRDGRHADPGGRVVLRRGDEGATRGLRADRRMDQRMAIQRPLDRYGPPAVERSVG